MTDDLIQAENTPKTMVSFDVCQAAGQPTIRHEFEVTPKGLKRIGEPREVTE